MVKTAKWIIVALHMALLAYMSLDNKYPKPMESLFRKVGSLALHGLGYFLLAILFGWAFMAKTKREALLALLAAFCYGFVLEIAQLYVPGREFSGADILVNLAGAAVGATTILIHAKLVSVRV